jgi:Ca2+-binding RTX toxin-like protein
MLRRPQVRNWFPHTNLRPNPKPPRSVRLLVEDLETRQVPATFTVLNTNDSGVGSLRNAVAQANANAGADTIVFGDGSGTGGTNFLDGTPDTITLTSGAITFAGDTSLTTVTGTGANLLSVSGGNIQQVFLINSGISTSISGMTIAHGFVNAGGTAGFGGAVSNSGALSMTDCTINGSSSNSRGGGLANLTGATATLTDCTISGNTAGFQGGGIENYLGSLTLTGCTVSGNTGAGSGGTGVNSQGGATFIAVDTAISNNSGNGLAANGTATLTNCTVSGNTANSGIIAYAGSMTLTNCTISGNQGGGIYLRIGSLNLKDVTISGNTASSSGGGISNTGGSGTLTIVNSIVSANTAPTSPDIVGTINNDNGHNLFGSALSGTATGTGDIFSDAPLLSVLDDFGGPTRTIVPLPGSPALGAGDNTGGPATDQRGLPRGTGAGGAIGAVDASAFSVSNINDSGAGSLRQAVLDANGDPTGDVIFFSSFFNTARTIILTSGELALTDSATTTIVGSGANLLTVSGSNTSRVFAINLSASAVISGLTITGGKDPSNFIGAGLRNDGTVTLNNVNVINNSGLGGGGIGGVANVNAIMTLNDCFISGNNIGVFTRGTFVMTNSTVSGNTGNNGGGLYTTGGNLTLTYSTFSGNTAGGSAGGLNVRYAAATLTNCTVSGNTCDNGAGGGVNTSAGGSAVLTNCTIVGNIAGVGAGDGAGGGICGSNITISNTIVAGNTAIRGQDVNATVTSGGNNLIGKIDSFSSGWVASDLTGTNSAPIDPQLAPLADNGGTVQTMALLPYSPAVNAGKAVNAPAADSRGQTRFGNTDIGAFEYQFKVTNTTDTTSPGSLRAAINSANAAPGADTIVFKIGSGLQTIAPTSPLPQILDFTVIDGTTQPGWAGSPLIELRGDSAGVGAVGLSIVTSGNMVRGLIINRFGDAGIDVSDGASSNLIVGNYIGTDPTGTIAEGNGTSFGGPGVRIRDGASNTTIGGTTVADRNVISGNVGHGILIRDVLSGNNLVEGNWIGTTATGAGALGNGLDGVHVQGGSSNNTIGGTAAGAGNTIAYNGGAGVLIADASANNSIRANAIFANSGKGIDLGTSLQASISRTPNLTGGTVGPQTRIVGQINPGSGGTTYIIDFFASDKPNASGFGDGQIYLGSTVAVPSGAPGFTTFDVVLPVATGADQVITMTATDPSGNTSGFSQVFRSNAAPNLDGADLNLVAAGVVPTIVVTQPNPKNANLFNVTGSVPDADPHNSYVAVIDWSDGQITTIPLDPTTISGGARHFNVNHTYPSDGDTIFAPTVRIALTDTLEGKAVHLTGQFADPDAADAHTVSIQWGDGTATTIPNSALVFHADTQLWSFDVPSHMFADNTSGVTATVVDGAGAIGAATTAIHVSNVAPTAAGFGPTGPVFEGTPANVSFTGIADPSPADLSAGLTYSVDFDGDGSFEVSGSSPTAAIPLSLLGQSGTLTVNGRVTDKDGGFTDYSRSVTVQPVPPTVSLTTDKAAYGENDFVVLSGTVTDPGINNGESVVINWADGSAPTTITLPPGTRTFRAIHQYVNNPTAPALITDPFRVVVTATNTEGLSGATALNIRVDNLPPTAVIRGLSAGTTNTLAFTSAGSDPGPIDAAHLVYAWQAKNSAGTVIASGSQRDFSFTRAANTTYRVTLTVTDPDGATATDTALVVSGTAGDDTIHVDPVPASSNVQVSVGSTTLGQFAPGDQVMVFGGAGNDTITVDPRVTAPTELDGEDGQDRLVGGGGPNVLVGGHGNDTAIAGPAGDLLQGDSPNGYGTSPATATDDHGADSLVGGPGNDTIDGGLGDDTMVGGASSDRYIEVPGSADVITESTSAGADAGGTDTIDYSQAYSKIVGGTTYGITFSLGQTGVAQTVYETNASVAVDPATVTIIGQFENAIGSAYPDKLTGNSVDNVMFGGDAVGAPAGSGDTLIGMAGNDSLAAGSGDNSLSGGTGNDTVIGGTGNDVIFGGDPVVVPPSGKPIDTTAGGAGSDSLVGGAGNDIIFGGDSGSVPDPNRRTTLSGGSGNDTVIGGSGNDVIFGGDAVPTVGTPVDTTAGGAGSDSLVGGAGNDVIFGGDPGSVPDPNRRTTLSGGTGNDTVIGGSGNDVIFGGDAVAIPVTGNPRDTTAGGAGSDSLVGGAGNDVIFGGDPGSVPDPNRRTTLSGGSGNDTVIGGSGNDVIFGGDAVALPATGTPVDTTAGGAGSDSLAGGAGNDVIFGGDSGSVPDPNRRTTLSGGTGNDTIIGGSGNDVIFGGDPIAIPATGNPQDTTVGGAGSDSLAGGAGNDVIFGGDPGSVPDPNRRTTLSGGSGNDTVIGGSGNDVIFGGDPIAIPATGNPQDTTVGGAGSDSLVGSAGNDIIFGGDPVPPVAGAPPTSPSTLSGGSGNDTVIGGSGNDVIFGGDPVAIPPSGAPVDTTAGGAGADSLAGGAGNDVIFGGDPGSVPDPNRRTTLSGGSGNDTVIGGSGNDVIFGGDSVNTTPPGASDSNSLVGGAGDDSIVGGNGNDTVTGGAGNDTVAGGAGNDVIFGGDPTDPAATGSDSLAGGAGDDTLTGGSGNDVIFGDEGIDTVSRTADADVTLSSSGLRYTNSTTNQDSFSGIEQAMLTGGAGNNVLDASGFSGNVTLSGGAGNDTLLGGIGNDCLMGGDGNDSMVGGAGDDTYILVGATPGDDTVVEAANGGKDVLNFFGLSGPVQFSLAASTGSTGAGSEPSQQAVLVDTTGGSTSNAGGMLTLTDPTAIEGLIGTPYADTLIGNAAGDTLIGAGGEDSLVGGIGNDLLQAGVTQKVYLDFDSYTVFGDRPYLQADRDAVQARLEADYSAFGYQFTQSRPIDGTYTTVFFNKTPFYINGIAQPGGISDAVDWRNLGLGGTVSVDVNGFLGYENSGMLAPTVDNFVGLSATIAAHELGHLSGLRHGDSFGPIGSGVFANTRPLVPAYAGAANAVDTPLHIMSSPASTRSNLIASAGDTFFGEREALKLAFADTGTVTAEGSTPHGVPGAAQSLILKPVSVPETLRAGADVGTSLSARAIDLTGSIQIDPTTGLSENDWYSFTANAGDVFTLEVLSRTLARIPQGIDSILSVTDANGNPIAYNTGFGTTDNSKGILAIADDNFENQDAELLDLRIPANGVYYVKIDTYTGPNVPDTDTGGYELFMYSAKPVQTPDPTMTSGDTIVGHTGDTVIGSSGKDAVTIDGHLTGAAAFRVLLDPPAAQFASEGAGQAYHLGSFTDPSDGPWSLDVNWGDGSSLTTPSVNPGLLADQLHTFAQSGTYTISVKVTDALGLSSSQSFPVTVANLAPTLTVAGGQTATTALSKSFSLGSFTDASLDGAWTIQVNWGDGSDLQAVQQATTGTIAGLAHTFAVAGNYSVQVSVIDKDGCKTTGGFPVTVLGAAPTMALSGAASSSEGSPYQLTLGSVSPSNIPISGYTIHWGDGTSETFTGSPGATPLTHTYADGPSSDTIAVDLMAGGLTFAAAGTNALTVNDVAPSIALGGADTAVKGQPYSLTLGTITDPGQDTVAQWLIHWPDGTSDTYTSGGTKMHTFGHGTASGPIVVDLIDEDGTHLAASTKAITVSGAAPPISSVTNSGPVNEGNPVTVTVAAADTVDGTSPLTYTFDFGGGYGAPQSNNSASFVFPDNRPGNSPYTVNVRVTDVDGTVSVASTTVVVINVAPTPTFTISPNTSNLFEGSPITATGSFTDPGGATENVTLSWAVYKDGSVTALLTQSSNVASPGTFVFTPPNNGQYQIVLTAADKDGGVAQTTQTVSVANVPVSYSTADVSLPLGSGAFSQTVAFTDPGADSWVGIVDYGDGSGSAALNINQANKTFTLNHTYTASGTYPVTVTVQDDGTPVTQTFHVTVQFNRPPVIAADHGTVTLTFGQTAANTGTFGDPDGNSTATLSASVGSVTANATTGTWSWMASGLTAGSRTVTITATDNGNLTATTSFTVTVNKATPTVSVTDGGGIYTGSAFPATATVGGVSGVPGATLEGIGLTIAYYAGTSATGSPLAGAPTAVGTYTAAASFAGSADYAPTSATVTFNISIRAEAGYILSPNGSGVVNAVGSATINLPGGLFVDSNAASAVVASGAARVQPNGTLQVVGGINRTGSAVAAKTGSVPPMGDPLASLPLPSLAGLTNFGAVTVSANSSRTLQPGIYTSIQVTGSSHATLAAGNYVILGGGLTVSGSATLNGSTAGVFIFNAGSNYNGTTDGGTYGAITLGGSGSIYLAPAGTGPYAGILIFQSRANTKVINISGAATLTTSGIIYAPAAQLALGGSATLHDTLVVNSLYLSGATGAFQLTSGTSSDYEVSTSNMLVSPVLTVDVQDDIGTGLDPTAVSDLDLSMAYLNEALAQFGVNLSWAPAGTDADVHLHFAPTTPEGGAADGVLGFTTVANDVYFAGGWNLYMGADPSGIGASQFDFRTLATHELAHALGLGESADPSSVMFEYLTPGTVRREFTETNLALINTDADRFMKAGRAVVPVAGSALTIRDLIVPTAVGIGLPALDPVGLTSRTRPHQAGAGGDTSLGGAGHDQYLGRGGWDLLISQPARDHDLTDPSTNQTDGVTDPNQVDPLEVHF